MIPSNYYKTVMIWCEDAGRHSTPEPANFRFLIIYFCCNFYLYIPYQVCLRPNR